MEHMKRVNRIIRHPLWQGAMAQIESMEETRVYCKHDLTHLLDTARLAYIENLEDEVWSMCRAYRMMRQAAHWQVRF